MANRSDDRELYRERLIEVVSVYWKSRKRIGFLNYIDPETGLIKRLKVVSTANREKENLNLMLDVKNVKITKGESYES